MANLNIVNSTNKICAEMFGVSIADNRVVVSTLSHYDVMDKNLWERIKYLFGVNEDSSLSEIENAIDLYYAVSVA